MASREVRLVPSSGVLRVLVASRSNATLLAVPVRVVLVNVRACRSAPQITLVGTQLS